jgi:hypothetical protein
MIGEGEMQMFSITRTATPMFGPTQTDASPAGRLAVAANTAGSLYPGKITDAQRLKVAVPIGPGSVDKNYLVSQLDSASKLAGLSFLCLREGDFQKAQQYMQEATNIRKSVEPDLTPSQQASLEKIMSLQQDAYQNIENEHNGWFDSIFGELKATIDLSQASTESDNLRNSILSEGQLKSA